MDYKNKYEQSIKRAKAMIKVANNQEEIYNSVITIFPELKENEDEKTKRMLHTIANKMSQHLRDIFTEEEFQCFDAWSNAWLEKQGTPAKLSEEDENILNGITSYLCTHDSCELDGFDKWYDFLKSLKDRIQFQSRWKPSEMQLDTIEQIIDGKPYRRDLLIKLFNDLKKLKK